jgi:predicted DNA-binding transcriptional regulator YafY
VDAARRCSGPAALALLRAAIADSQSVSMSYAEDDGVDADRLLDPIRLGGGSLTAFDHRAGQVRTFTLARVSSVAPILAQREGEAGHD